ncbi:hypothetical protein [Streptomyces sp. NPDC101165]|uniref:hypothetical protein n=1 Tax=Streptomyces sp. NPDC101165 TaxID=3366119 RepID=UPI0038245E02
MPFAPARQRGVARPRTFKPTTRRLHSPFEGPRGAADHETLSNVLRYAEGWESAEVDQDEEQAAERVAWSMVRAALGI